MVDFIVFYSKILGDRQSFMFTGHETFGKKALILVWALNYNISITNNWAIARTVPKALLLIH